MICDPASDSQTRRQFLRKSAQLSVSLATVSSPVFGAELASPGSRISYYRDGEIYVTQVGKPEGKPLTTGYWDFKPSWSVTDNMLVCFRRLKDDPVTEKWKTAIFTMNADGSGQHFLTDGSRTDFNPTWTRDGRNMPVWSRRNEKTGGYHVLTSKIGDKPGNELVLTDQRYHTWAHSCLKDGRILVNAVLPKLGSGVFLLSTKPGGTPAYEPVTCELSKTGQLHRASISPSEKQICFEYLPGFKFREPGHILYIADFDATQRTISNPRAIANHDGKSNWFAYPRWIDGESAVVYHLNKSGKGELFVYRLKEKTTTLVSTSPSADYRYPHGESAPC